MTPEIEKLHKQIIYSDKTTEEAKWDAYLYMWENKVKFMIYDDVLEFIDSIPNNKENRIMEKVKMYFDGCMSQNFGFKDSPMYPEPVKLEDYWPKEYV